MITRLPDCFRWKLNVGTLEILKADNFGLGFTEPFEQVRQPEAYVVDVETGDLHRPFHTSSRRPYRQNRRVRRLKNRITLGETATQSHLSMMSGRRRMGHHRQFWGGVDHATARACAVGGSDSASASVTETDPDRLSSFSP